MSKKDNILEAWIMVEHLSEGDINLREKSVITLNGLQDNNYYGLLIGEIQKKKMAKYQKGGIVVYFDIFSFNEVIDFLRKKYHLSPTEQEISVGDKFSFALYFDKELKLNSELTFLTESYYIRKYKRIPKETEFLMFEEENRKRFEELFECPKEVDYAEHFNIVMASILENNHIATKNCRMKVLLNLETDATNLHSFFVGDLEKAKTIQTKNLDDYISGKAKRRIDLDSRAQSEKFNADVFNRILQPSNYPIARFPSNPEHALSFMQQVAVNLSIGFDNEQIRSVNGPPGTGKTTLLKDIFAELVVRQAYEISSLSEKYIKGSETTTYWKNASIGILPEKIAEKGIVVASSNNGAVQNIVNELPLLSGIDEEFQEAIIGADYFRTIANSKVAVEWIKDENGVSHEELKRKVNKDSDKFWGLFSLEGGRKEYMNYIVTVLKHVVQYLENEYVSDSDVYQDFMKQYDELYSCRNERQKIADIINKHSVLLKEIEHKHKEYIKEKQDRQTKLEEEKVTLSEVIQRIQNEIIGIEAEMQAHREKLSVIQDDKDSVTQCVDALKLQKPGFFSSRKVKREYKERARDYSEQLQKLIIDEHSVKGKITEMETQLKRLGNEMSNKKAGIAQNENLLENWSRKTKEAIAQIEKQAEALKQSIQDTEVKDLDFLLDYESLQLSNPWFDIEYRKLQSQLFITALKVRKQFLYENIKNIKAAYMIWSKQKEHLNHKAVITEAWNWINMVIPVISSTFFSFARMCANMGKETLGHLFVDEAGQALPQASVGAIFRSRYVMVVGDPSQIKPVLTLDSSVLNMLGEYYGVSQQYLSENASTQTLVDEISRYGFYKDINREEWIGIPLWVHRRCKSPMFDIANKISYGGNMVQAGKENGLAKWFDIGGCATDKYVAEQGTFLREKIQEMILQNPDIIDKEKKDIIYVISPFKNVAYQLSQELRKIGFTRYDEHGKPTNVGTVHTFQGKEAPIVFLVLGADEKSIGAASWAMGTENPNIMNVAATRAKEQFYLIGDKKLYLRLRSDVINDTYKIIQRFNEGV